MPLFRILFDGSLLYIRKLRQFSRNAWLVLVYSFFTGLVFGVFRFLFNFYVLSLGPEYTESFLGTLQSLASLAAVAMAVPAAWLAERYSQKRIMVVTGLLAIVGLVGIVGLPYRWSLIAFNMLISLSFSVRQVAMAPFLMQNTGRDERQWVFSFNFGIMTTSMFFGNLLGGNLPTWLGATASVGPTDTLAYQLALVSMTIIGLLAVVPVTLIRMPPVDPDRVVELPWTLLGQHWRTLFKFVVPQLIIGLGAGLMMPFMNVYFRNVYDRPDPTISIVFAIGGLGMAVAQFAGPPVADRIGKINTVVLTQALSIPFLLTLGLGAYIVPSGLGSAGVWFVVAGVAYIFRLALMNASNPVYQTFTLEHVPDNVQALAMSLNSLTFQFGWFVMPNLSGYLQTRYGEYGFVPIFIMVVMFYVTAIVVEMVWFRQERLATAMSAAD